VKKAKAIINRNIELLHPIVKKDRPMVGIEPSAILTFRDEYIDLATDENLGAGKIIE
jgi:Fe-S oxidoreductase